MAQQASPPPQTILDRLPYSTVEFMSILMKGVIPFKFTFTDVMDCFLGEDVGPRSLLKAALLGVIEKALNKTEKRVVLRELVLNCYEPNGFGPLIFSDSSPIRKFIVRFLAPTSRVQMIEIMETETRFILNGCDFHCDHSKGVLLDKILDLLPVVLTANVRSACIFVAECLPQSREIFERIAEVSDICLSHLYTSSSLVRGNYRRGYRATFEFDTDDKDE